jgi:zinc transport system substrate-binding protein
VKKLIPVIILLIIVVIAIVVLMRDDRINDELTIVTTFYPPAEFATQIAKEKINVINITSGGIEPHDFEPTPKDLVEIQNADLFIINGNDFDHWAEELVQENDDINALILSEHIDSDLADDPHFWLDPVHSIDLVEIISKKIIDIDPKNKDFYEQNTTQYIEELDKLNNEFQTELAVCTNRKIVVSHDAFSYLSNRYTFEIINIAGLSPEEEPSAKVLTEISNTVIENGIKYIFYETLVSSDLANTIADETGASTLVLNPLEGLTPEEISNGENYVSIMRNNLNNLKVAMECK